MSTNENFAPGHRWHAGPHMFQFAVSGNLEVRDRRHFLLWESGTAGKPAARLSMQVDGNLVLYDRNSRPLWASNTSGNPGASLVALLDGNVVIRSPRGDLLWQTATTSRL